MANYLKFVLHFQARATRGFVIPLKWICIKTYNLQFRLQQISHMDLQNKLGKMCCLCVQDYPWNIHCLLLYYILLYCSLLIGYSLTQTHSTPYYGFHSRYLILVFTINLLDSLVLVDTALLNLSISATDRQSQTDTQKEIASWLIT